MPPKLTDGSCETKLASESCWSMGIINSNQRSLRWLHFMLEFKSAIVYVPRMSQTLEKRVEELEKKVAELSGKPGPALRKKDPWRTYGIFKDDPDFEEAVRLGR